MEIFSSFSFFSRGTCRSLPPGRVKVDRAAQCTIDDPITQTTFLKPIKKTLKVVSVGKGKIHVLHESYVRGISPRFHLPHCLIVWSGIPLIAASVAAPIRKECVLNSPVMLQNCTVFASMDEN